MLAFWPGSAFTAKAISADAVTIYNFDLIQTTAANAAVVRLSPLTLSLVAAALDSMTYRFAWQETKDNDPLWDLIEAAVADAYREVWTNMVIGSVVMVAGPLPEGMLLCDGSTYQRVDYPLLYAYLAPVYIVDADSFTVPNLIARFQRGAASEAAIGGTGGAATVTLTESEIPPHSHNYVPPVANVDLESPGAPDIFAAGIGLPTSTGATGGGQPHENLPPYEDLLPCIIAL